MVCIYYSAWYTGTFFLCCKYNSGIIIPKNCWNHHYKPFFFRKEKIKAQKSKTTSSVWLIWQAYELEETIKNYFHSLIISNSLFITEAYWYLLSVLLVRWRRVARAPVETVRMQQGRLLQGQDGGQPSQYSEQLKKTSETAMSGCVHHFVNHKHGTTSQLTHI